MIHRNEYATEAEWLAARAAYVTASDAAILCGEGRISMYSYWHEKAGNVTPEPMDADLAKWGHQLEAAMCQWCHDKLRTEYKYVSVYLQPHVLWSNDAFPALAATPDALLFYGDNADAPTRSVIECKNRAFESWKEGVPLDVQIQVQVQLGILELDHGYVMAQLGGRPPQMFRLEFNEKFFKAIHAEAQKFLDSIAKGIEPTIDGSDRARKTLRKLNSKIGLDMVQLDEQARILDEEYARIRAERLSLEKREAEIENVIEQAIGDGAAGMLPNAIWTRTVVARDGYTVKPTTHLQLNRKERKV
jgi:predicted phage-related endonuclease